LRNGNLLPLIHTLTIPVCLAALFSYVNHRLSKLPITILTRGGLRGGISVALALSFPAGPMRDAVVTITYAVVVFSILVQGLTINRVLGTGTGNSKRRQAGSTL
jgi:NhaP-type Na+/H+ or K+/H+ antiporter